MTSVRNLVENLVVDQTVTPTVDATYDLGTSTSRFRNIFLSSGIKSPVPVTVLSANTAAQAISAVNSGSTFLIPTCTVNITVTLPPVAVGLKYKFVVQNLPDGTHTVTFAFPAGTVYGSRDAIGSAAIANVTLVAQSNVVLGATAANVNYGDYLDVTCDGTKYLATIVSHGTATAWTNS